MDIKLYQVDAFATNVFEGNPAAVCPLDHWLDDHKLQKIAEENNLSETAFFVQTETNVELRWFTPEDEVDLCGHATLAAAHVLFTHLHFAQPSISFSTRSGILIVEKTAAGYSMDFPATIPSNIDAPSTLIDALGITPKAVYLAFDYVVILENQQQVSDLKPDFAKMAELDHRGVVVTAKDDEHDFVSRCFFPKLRVNEDPVTGSAHCELAPYWQRELNKDTMIAKQLSKRSGVVHCDITGERVVLSGHAVDFMQGTITL
ncbi:PhzF family phenazine biosynthesis protein [Vibrio ulleungensis]|uniref:PhzF family phenazine biosynthesis protein n=1 Tax=Vibrio ulleungensis TaxID=2807619 RepID=A0ABS2HGY9_9VIBR|nr:PhzF family phenazine biosynthesis protein [Vibrio ulleungensis]MBM7035357.1 PhzF family phenazine biosynthesis protein [Vibrio ulleungensis]